MQTSLQQVGRLPIFPLNQLYSGMQGVVILKADFYANARVLKVRSKMFFVFGDRGEQPDELTMIVKLPISAGMVQDLPSFAKARAGSGNTIG